jgi:Leucine-rich repeat (LRR) protein
LVYLDLGSNQVSDLTPLTNLTQLFLAHNPIASLTPLVDSLGLNKNDAVYLLDTNLSCANEKANLDALASRGVLLFSSPYYP